MVPHLRPDDDQAGDRKNRQDDEGSLEHQNQCDACSGCGLALPGSSRPSVVFSRRDGAANDPERSATQCVPGDSSGSGEANTVAVV
jgi:hypothetical protein